MKKMPPSAKSSLTTLGPTNRRAFCRGATSLLLARPALLNWSAFAQAPFVPASPTRPDVAAIDHDRILAAAQRCLSQPPTPLTSLQCERSPGTVHDYYSETVPEPNADIPVPAPSPFTAHRDTLFQLGLIVPALAAAYFLTGEERYAEHATLHLRAWFMDPATRMTPALNFGQVLPGSSAGATTPTGGRYHGILETLPLVEVAQAIPFLAASPAFSQTALTALHAWFATYLRWLTAPQDSGPRLAALARDQKNHHASSWLLQACAYATLPLPQGDAARSEDTTLAELRHRFRTVTLRAQFNANGTFTHELGSPNPSAIHSSIST